MVCATTCPESNVVFSDQSAAFLVAVAPHRARLLAYAQQLTGYFPDAGEELLHEALLVCHARIERKGFHGGDSEYVGYLFTQLKHLHRRQQQVRLARPATVDADLCGQLPEEADSQLDAEVLAAAVLTYVHAHYPAAWEQVFELYCQGLSYPEITFATGVAKSTAQQRVEKIKADLRREFGHHFAA